MLLFVFSTDERVPLHCVDRHPSQQHIVGTGGQDGTLCIWDIRQGSVPISVLDAHSAESEFESSHLTWPLITEHLHY